MIEVLDGWDLSGVPIPFLEAHPFPAFALAVPIPHEQRRRSSVVSSPADSTSGSNRNGHPDGGDVSPHSGQSISSSARSSCTVVWSNEKWLQITEGRPILECLGADKLRKLQTWVEDVGHPVENSLFHLDLRNPHISLSLSKTCLPLTPPSATHSFCVVTSQPGPIPFSPQTPSRRGTGNREIRSPPLQSRLSNEAVPMASRGSTSTLGPEERVSSPLTAASDVPSSRHDRRSRKSNKRTAVPRLEAKETSLQMMSVSDVSWNLVENFDWSKTPLGPREQWSDAVDPLLSVMFQSSTMDCIWLGEEIQLIYNKEYSQIVDHPAAFGQPGAVVWAPIWDYVGPMVDQVLSGTPVEYFNDLLLFKKFGPDEILLETYFTWRYVPISSRDGKIMGFYNQARETTDVVLADRRLTTSREISEAMLLARSTKDYYSALAEVLGDNRKDIPFGMFYSVNVSVTAPKETAPTSIHVDVALESSAGVPEDHPNVPKSVKVAIPLRNRSTFGPNAERLSSPTMSAISALSSGSARRLHFSDDSSWPILKALATRQCVLVEDCRELIHDFPLREWDELPSAALVIPICSENTVDVPEALMIIGLNYHRPFDMEYEGWLHDLRTSLTSFLVSVKGYEMEQQRVDDTFRMEKAKAAWFRGAAHDLRSPLTLIRGPIEDLLSDDQLSPHQKRSLTLARRNIDRLLRLVNALMDFSRLEAGRVQARFVPMDLGQFVDELASLFRPALERLQIEYIVDVQAYDRLVYFDPTLLETVLSNLLTNALKYTERGSVTVRLTYGSDSADIAIIDSGIGIPQDEMEDVAKWFHRASTAVHAGTQGTGLGLALAKELLRLHGGDLLVTSMTASENQGQHGSTFLARIPLTEKPEFHEFGPAAIFGQYGSAAANEALGWVRDHRACSEAGSEDGGPSDAMGSNTGSGSKFSDGLLFEKTDTLLIVDDNLEMRDYMRRIFTPYCRVIDASGGEEALDLALRDPPDLIISDVMMPGMSGLDLLSAIRSQSSHHIPMVILSAMTGDEARLDTLLAGAEDYLEKPFKPRELLARVHLHMQFGKQRVRMEKLFAEKEVQIRVMTEYCPSGISMSDGEGNLIYVNAAWRALQNMGPDDDPNTWRETIDPSTQERLWSTYTAFVQGDQREVRSSWRTIHGRSISGVFVRLEKISSTMSGVIGCLSDITHEEQKLIDAEERRKEAEESKHQQELLIDLTSHEIRTPVSAILQCSSLVKENLVSLKDELRATGTAGFRPNAEFMDNLEQDVEALESIYQCGLVQERIAADILSLARIQLDMLSIHSIEMDLRREAKKVLSVFASEAKMKKIELCLEIGESIDLLNVGWIKTDPVRLGQIVTNLISNAIRFTAPSTTRKITLTYDASLHPPPAGTCAPPLHPPLPPLGQVHEDTPVYLFVSVRDTGPGLGPQELELLFQRFSQGNKMIHTRYGGSGLGLFICRKIAELLGGRIEVKSQLGHGSVFRFFVCTHTCAPPRPSPSLASITQGTSDLSMTSFTSTRPSIGSPSLSNTSSIIVGPLETTKVMEKLHILVVEDNQINQTILKRQMVKAGLTCEVADNGQIALDLIYKAERDAEMGTVGGRRYDVILMDLEMPVMDGITAIQKIRAAEAIGQLKRNTVIALTGNARQGQIDHAIEVGMDDVVIKPYHLDKLLKQIPEVWRAKTRPQSLQYPSNV